MKKIVSLVLALLMIVGCMSMAAFAEQNVNVRTTAFGNNYDVQDMGWRWMMAACYDGLYRNVADSEGEHFILAGAESVDVSEDGTVYTYHLRQNACWSDGVWLITATTVFRPVRHSMDAVLVPSGMCLETIRFPFSS